ncbi:MAG: hypothetical protein ABSD89_07760, partial [Halobacteriota archaeon]
GVVRRSGSQEWFAGVVRRSGSQEWFAGVVRRSGNLAGNSNLTRYGLLQRQSERFIDPLCW